MLMPTAVALIVVFLVWIYHAIRPPPPKLCGAPGGPSVTSPRVRLSDGRHLAYREAGVPKEDAKFKILVVHGFNSSKDVQLPEFMEDQKIYFLFFDRAGYGDSDPYPSRSVKSEAFDVQALADELQIGPKFYLMGLSMGAYTLWSCLKYIPHRLSGVALVVPFVNYWWPCFPASLSRMALGKLPKRDQWVFRIAHYSPWLFYWWMTQKWFPTLSVMSGNMSVFCAEDLDVLSKLSETLSAGQEKVKQQGEYESLFRDMMAGYGEWEFDPLDIKDLFPNNEGSVHIWQGHNDKFIPKELNRYLSEKLPWIRYHEVHNAGHFLIYDSSRCETILRELLHQ